MRDDAWVRLYHPNFSITLALLGIFTFLTGCAAPELSQGQIQVFIQVDGEEITTELPAGSTVEDAIDAARIAIEPLDRADPPLYTVVGEGSEVEVIRIREEFIVEQEVIPFESQLVRNESLPEGE
jgi:uncharacterized protein YabE (DUF348 family)